MCSGASYKINLSGLPIDKRTMSKTTLLSTFWSSNDQS